MPTSSPPMLVEVVWRVGDPGKSMLYRPDGSVNVVQAGAVVVGASVVVGGRRVVVVERRVVDGSGSVVVEPRVVAGRPWSTAP